MSEDEFSDLPYHLRRAALRDGMEGLLDAGFRRGQVPPDAGSSSSSSGNGSGPAAAAVVGEGTAHEADYAAWAPGVHGPSWRRQYIFVAATMPSEGDHSVGAELAARFPDAAWLAGRQLHQSKRAVEHAWRRVDDPIDREEALQVRGWVVGWWVRVGDWLEAGNGAGCWVCSQPTTTLQLKLSYHPRHTSSRIPPRPPSHCSPTQEIVAADEQLAAGRGRMLVFARDVASADTTAAALAAASPGVPVLRYHKGVPAGERAAALARLAGEEGLVMVCTDAAARGLDVADVTHVVQVRWGAVWGGVGGVGWELCVM